MGCFVRGFSSSSSLIIGRHSPLFAAVVSVYSPGQKGEGEGENQTLWRPSTTTKLHPHSRGRDLGAGEGGGEEAY